MHRASARTSNRLYAAAVACLVVAAVGLLLDVVPLGLLALAAMLLYVIGNRIDPRDAWRRNPWG
jgi:hypothetical protein